MKKRTVISYSNLDASNYFGVAKTGLLLYIAVDYFGLNSWWIGSFSALLTIGLIAVIVSSCTAAPIDIFEYIDRRIDQKIKK